MASANSLFSRFWQSRWVRWPTYLLAFLIAVYATLMIWMNRKGERDWKAAQEKLLREGVELNYREQKVVSVPDERNFCAIPLLNGIAVVEDGDPDKGEPAAKRKALESIGLPPYHAAYSRPSITGAAAHMDVPLDLREWTEWLRKTGHPMPVTDPDNAAREVLAALSYQDAAVAEMVAVLGRPESRLVPDWRVRPFPELLLLLQVPHLSALQNLSNGLSLRAKAAAHAGGPAKAHEAALCLSRIAEATCQEPHVLGLLVGMTSASVFAQTVWELGATHSGAAEDFQRLQHALEKFDLRRDTERAFKEEIVASMDSILYLKHHRKLPASAVEAMDWGYLDKWVWLVPRGWFESSAAHTATLNIDHIVRPLRDRGWSAALAEGERLESRLNAAKAEIWWHPDMIVAVLAMPAFTRIVDRAAYAQCHLDRAIIACALERYRFEHGTYPDALAKLARRGEKPLPLDILSGTPMGYRKTEDGRYLLWAVGFDGVDDGGQRSKSSGPRGKPTHRDYEGDWVWTYPTAEEIAASRASASPPVSKKRTPPKGKAD